MLGVAAHRAVVDREALGRLDPRLPVEGQSPAVLLHHQVRDHRGSEQAAREQLLGHGGRDQLEHGLLVRAGRVGGGCRLVGRSGDDHAHPAAATIPQLEALLEADALDGAFERGIEDLHALLGQILVAEVATAGRLDAPLGRGRRLRGVARQVGRCRRRGLVVELFGEGVELRLGLCELHLQLRGIDALGLREVDPPSKKLHLLLELLVGTAQRVTLSGHLRERRLRSHQRRVRGRERRFELRDTSDELRPVEGHALEHSASGNHARDPCRSPWCSKRSLRSHHVRWFQCSRGRRVRARGAASTSMPSSKASSVASSTSTWRAPSAPGSGRRKVPRSSLL